MKLWLLRPVDDLPNGGNPWEPWYDKVFGFVVRAETEDQARQIAQEECGCENEGNVRPWLNSQLSTCVVLTESGEPGVVIRDYMKS